MIPLPPKMTNLHRKAASVTGGEPLKAQTLSDAQRDALMIEQVIADVHSRWATVIGTAIAIGSFLILLYGLNSINREIENRRIDRSYDFVMLTLQPGYSDAIDKVIESIYLASEKNIDFSEYIETDRISESALSRLLSFYNSVGSCVAFERCDAITIEATMTTGTRELIERICPYIISVRKSDPDYMVGYADLVGARCS